MKWPETLRDEARDVAYAYFDKEIRLITDRERVVSGLTEMLDKIGKGAFETPKIPSSVKRVSWYSLKVRVNFNISCEAKSKLWSFGPLG